jgi:dihydroorotase
LTVLTLRRPDDWHVHLRDGHLLEAVVGHTARQFARAIVMPNLKPPITTVAEASAYRMRILNALQRQQGDEAAASFTPLMTAYLTETMAPAELEQGFGEGVFQAAKLYPAGATTNSDAGVRDLRHITPLLSCMEEIGMPLLIHGEVTDGDVDIFDREAVFIERHLEPLLQRHPQLKVVLEHITTADAVAFVQQGPANLAATITPHHLHINRNALFQGGLRPDMYCLPVAKREKHRLALRAAATSGHPRFFLGTDSAPHPRHAKESSCGCAGIYNAPYAIESYAQVFSEEQAIDKLENFASVFGPRFYGLPLNEGTIRLAQQSEHDARPIPALMELPNGSATATVLAPFHGGETLCWRLL